MKDELKKYKNCPVCGEDWRNHDMGDFAGAEERFKSEIELNRDDPDFRNWLIEQRRDYMKKIHRTHLDCESDLITVNHTGMILLGVWYNYIDIVDEESRKLTIEPEGEYLIKESAVVKLYEEFKYSFPSEDLRTWKLRWLNGSKDIPPIVCNEEPILFMILSYARPKLENISNMNVYAKTAWGIKSYGSKLCRCRNANVFNTINATYDGIIQKILKDA